MIFGLLKTFEKSHRAHSKQHSVGNKLVLNYSHSWKYVILNTAPKGSRELSVCSHTSAQLEGCMFMSSCMCIFVCVTDQLVTRTGCKPLVGGMTTGRLTSVSEPAEGVCTNEYIRLRVCLRCDSSCLSAANVAEGAKSTCYAY